MKMTIDTTELCLEHQQGGKSISAKSLYIVEILLLHTLMNILWDIVIRPPKNTISLNPYARPNVSLKPQALAFQIESVFPAPTMASEEEKEYPGNAKHHRSTDLRQLSSACCAQNCRVPIRISCRAWRYSSTWRESCVWREERRGQVTNGVIVRSAGGLDLRGPPDCVIVILAYCQSVSRKFSFSHL
jgi:hypothetical protein